MYAVGKFHLLQIFLECLEVGRFAVAGVVGIYRFEDLAYCQVVAAVLIPQYVAACYGCFGEEVYEFFLLQRQVFEVGHLVAQDFYVGKAVDYVVEIVVTCLFGLGRAGHECGGQQCGWHDAVD